MIYKLHLDLMNIIWSEAKHSKAEFSNHILKSSEMLELLLRNKDSSRDLYFPNVKTFDRYIESWDILQLKPFLDF